MLQECSRRWEPAEQRKLGFREIISSQTPSLLEMESIGRLGMSCDHGLELYEDGSHHSSGD